MPGWYQNKIEFFFCLFAGGHYVVGAAAIAGVGIIFGVVGFMKKRKDETAYETLLQNEEEA